jgi:FAD/FMN-containing dehydrogenase
MANLAKGATSGRGSSPNMLGAEDPEEVTDTVLKLVAAPGGGISSEHGVGRAMTRWLGLIRTPEEIDTMWRIKRALDPEGLLNPSVLLSVAIDRVR